MSAPETDPGGSRGPGPAARAVAWLSTEHWMVGAALTRVSLGLWGVYYYALHFPVRAYLWGPHGVWPAAQFLDSAGRLNIFRLAGSPLAFDALYLAGMGIAVLLALGVWPRLMTAAHWLFVWSLQERNPFIGDGGDNIMRIVLLFLILVDTGACLTIRARRGRSHALRAVAHNYGVMLILAQLGLLYASTGLYKVMGELWQNGTALYYILRVDEFTWPGVADRLIRNPWFVVGGTYGTVFFELLFLPALLTRWTRYVLIPVGMLFHAGIALFMGLVTFGWSMLSLYPLLVTDAEYRALAAAVRRRFLLTVYYDGWCPFCTRSIGRLARLDLLGLVRYVSLRDTPDVDPQRAERRIQSRTSRGVVREGLDVFVQIAGRSVVLWPMVPLLLLVRMATGQRLYDALAGRRLILVPGRCDVHCDAAGGIPNRT